MTEPQAQPPADNTARRSPAPALLIFLLFPLLGVVAAIAISLAGQPGAQADATPAPVTLPPMATRPQLAGRPAPDFEIATMEQTTVSLSDYRGRIVFLNFWATWCVPCERELPTFEAFMAGQPDNGPIVLAVNIGETYDQVNAYLNERGISGFPVLLDPRYEVAALYGINPIPVTFVLDAEGVIRYSKFGEITMEDINEYLKTLSS